MLKTQICVTRPQCVKTLSVSQTWRYVRILCEWWIRKEMAKAGRGLIEMAHPDGCKDRVKTMNLSTVGVPIENWTGHPCIYVEDVTAALPCWLSLPFISEYGVSLCLPVSNQEWIQWTQLYWQTNSFYLQYKGACFEFYTKSSKRPNDYKITLQKNHISHHLKSNVLVKTS